MRQIRNTELEQKESHCFARQHVNTKRTQNKMCLWICESYPKTTFKKIFKA
jgi:hypothetical protein